ncbi:hypothetical protein KP79_PYT11457 [Mizuhopecten yessoensis]|uniref:Uncharacterized protein n=2 Tax=Mizuhopecten yessoensis TaxID=6573 RepID=A0A210PDW6_MIZYE|nr:hypothetical protein KP79_PYT11457 [Mizuhopecten yessoensis]
MAEIMLFLLALACGLVQGEWSAPDSIPIPCGKSTCDIWTEYCHFKTCMKCNTDVCSMSLSPGGRPVQCYFYCMDVKKMMQLKVLEETTSPALQTSTDTFTKAPGEEKGMTRPVFEPGTLRTLERRSNN